MSEPKLLPEPPDTIYLLDEYDQWIWCDTPDPDYEDRRIIKYTRIPAWIPVSERLPEKSGFYQIWDTKKLEDGREIGIWIRYYFASRGKFEDTVTHWMPLPDSPEGKG